MKFAFVIAALFAASAIAAPCGRKHVDQAVDAVDTSVLDDPSAPTDAPVKDTTGPEDLTVNDTTGTDDVTLDDTPATPPSSSSPDSDQEDEIKSTEVIDTNEQTAVINANSGDKSKGSLFGFDASNFGAGGLFSHSTNAVSQTNH